MTFVIADLSDLTALPFDEIIDVRSPAEFAIDHLPGAINLPVLSDAERAEVGTIYVQDSKFRARKVGAALIARNAAQHIETHLADKTGEYAPLIYCWRGGQRSGSFATILKQIGWRVQTLQGGYTSYRRAVVRILYAQPFPCKVILVSGNTGTAKTEFLLELQALGQQVINLEGLANHRGSLFGARATQQPSQKAFETEIAGQMAQFDPERPVLVEAESSRIGECRLPPALWNAMKVAPRIEIEASIDARSAYLAKTYRDITSNADQLSAMINRLRRYHAAETIEDWQTLAESGKFQALAAELMLQHYDPRYTKQGSRSKRAPARTVPLGDLSPETVQSAAREMISLIPSVANSQQ